MEEEQEAVVGPVGQADRRQSEMIGCALLHRPCLYLEGVASCHDVFRPHLE